MIALALYGLFSSLRGRIADTDGFSTGLWLRVLPFAIALPFIANTSGWILTEMGRQPWVAYGLLLTADGSRRRCRRLGGRCSPWPASRWSTGC
jgi:cytochrome bd ubiquinol oxidase subunit I